MAFNTYVRSRQPGKGVTSSEILDFFKMVPDLVRGLGSSPPSTGRDGLPSPPLSPPKRSPIHRVDAPPSPNSPVRRIAVPRDRAAFSVFPRLSLRRTKSTSQQPSPQVAPNPKDPCYLLLALGSWFSVFSIWNPFFYVGLSAELANSGSALNQYYLSILCASSVLGRVSPACKSCWEVQPTFVVLYGIVAGPFFTLIPVRFANVRRVHQLLCPFPASYDDAPQHVRFLLLPFFQGMGANVQSSCREDRERLSL
ncbi:hypothetical protein BDP27DRAFT_274477 [Rhodocollybia butyracea]|uniref:Uncharacterized protein n=1 Tax=Rhodocollybia butyracea TaxID=206335 RepID=A0A9P5U1Q3_9AGAR|nr:hypothetical protein BDP27DRAFT_274477 [Rhodocollybia butyracea]